MDAREHQPAHPESLVSANAAPSAAAGLLAARLLPELLSLLLALAIALAVLPERISAPPQTILQWFVMTEGVTLMFLCTAIDIASRLRRAPPWWGGLLLCVALLVVYPQVPLVVFEALREGLWIALPFAWSIIERLRELWTLPGQPTIEKLRRRALTFGRLYSGLVLAGVYVVTSLLENLTISPHGVGGGVVEGLAPWFIAAFFALAAHDTLRVHRPAFAVRPGNLWSRFDGLQSVHPGPIL